MSDYEEGVDESLVGFTILCIIIIVFVVIAYFSFSWYVTNESLKNRCDGNPRLLYASTCSDYDDCISKCIDNLGASS